jgi:hypothetical protein
MSTIYITTDKDHPEDDIFELVEALSKVVGKEHIHASSAIAVYTDDPAIAKIFTTIGRDGIESTPKKSKLTGTCPGCGQPCTPGGFCRKCQATINANKARAAKAYSGIKTEKEDPNP